MKWFGRPYGAGYEHDFPHVETPVGIACAHCGEAIAEGDSGVIISGPIRAIRPRHYECFFRPIAGGVNHQLGRCFCCGGDQPPDPDGMTRREAAKAALEAWEQRGRFRAE
jgi:hypothetical protein